MGTGDAESKSSLGDLEDVVYITGSGSKKVMEIYGSVSQKSCSRRGLVSSVSAY